jgi:hypothetical protein
MLNRLFASLATFFTTVYFLLVAGNLHAAIDLTLDVTGVETTGTTLSTKVFVERLELSFPNNRASQSVAVNTPGFYAKARFKYLGNGPLTARWIVDGRVISQTTQLLTFGKEVVIRSDRNKVYLPTFQRGIHTVSLQLQNSAGVIDTASRSIKYFVSDGVAEFQSDSALEIMYPKNREVDPLNFYFRWKGLANFGAYQLEVERMASKQGQSATVIRALSRIDVYAPSDKQRMDLLAGNYRWRVKGLYTDKKNTPLESEWANFSVIENQQQAGGVFIKKVVAQDSEPSLKPTQSSLQIVEKDIPDDQRLTQSRVVIAQGKISAGSPYSIQVDIQNSGFKERSDLMLDVRNQGEVLGRFPVTVSSGKTASVIIPLQSAAVTGVSFETLSIQVVANNNIVDQAAINLTLEPRLRLDQIDFNEVSGIAGGNFPIADPFGCGRGTTPDRNLAFSRVVSARNISQPDAEQQSILQQGYFHFDQNEQVEFTVYFKDLGLGDWFDASVRACNANVLLPGDRVALENERDDLVQQLQQCWAENINGDIDKACGSLISSIRNITVTLAQADAALGNTSIPLKFIAWPLDRFGQINGEPIVIGSVALDKGFEGLLTSAQWRIPQSGQYKISLNDIGEAADLYATLPGGFPRYVHAGGFVLDVQQIGAGSGISNLQPRQAIVSGSASSRWQGDTRNSELVLDFSQISVTMSNPLHGELTGGQINLRRAPNMIIPQLRLYAENYELLDLNLSLSGAQADLSYRLPDGYSRANTVPQTRTFNSAGLGNSNLLNGLSTTTSSGRKTGTITSAQPTTIIEAFPSQSEASNAGELINFNDVDVLNGGEFIARFDFDNSWADKQLKGFNLALRLKGSTLVLDASPHLSYTDYTGQANFIGNGIHNALIRVKVNNSNNLFDVSNADNAFVYGKANWLTFSDEGISGEEIEVLPVTAAASFFNQKADAELSLLKPFGFNLRINDGIFNLENSQVGGINFAGSVALPQTAGSSVSSDTALNFQHLTRQLASVSEARPIFSTEDIQLTNQRFSVGVFEYQPQTARLNIGHSPIQIADSPVRPQNLEQMEYRDLDNWHRDFFPSLNDQAGLLLNNGSLAKGWELIGDESAAQLNRQPRGVFLVNQTGLQGQWAEISDPQDYRINGFDTNLSGLWLKFKDSALVDSYASGLLNIPYPVQQSFIFTGRLNQEADIQIASDALRMQQQAQTDGYLDLPYWHARLTLPANNFLNTPVQPVNRGRQSPIGNSVQSPLLFDAENQRIKLQDMGLSLTVDESKGGEEFIGTNGAIPFSIDTFIQPNGQLAETTVSPKGDLFFIGQKFTPDSTTAISFIPYFGDHQPPAADAVATAQPLVEINGAVNFGVFGPQQVKIQHTAIGARVPEIKRAPNVEENWGEGVIRVNADLKFVNTFGLNPSSLNNFVNNTASGVAGQSADSEDEFKAFVGKADLVIIDAVSIKGLAEAGLHYQQSIDGQGNWLPLDENRVPEDQVAYERIGLGAGADLLKATLAGVRGLETTTRIGGAIASGAFGADVEDQQLIDLVVNAVSFVESVALATSVVIAGGTVGSGEVVHAIDNGLATTNSGIQLIKTICEQDTDCPQDAPMQLDIASLLVRVAGTATHIDELATDPQEVASISLQTLDIGIPVLQGMDLDQALSMAGAPDLSITLNDKKTAGLSAAHAVVGAARSIVDKNGRISFNDFINISRRSVKAARDMSQITEIRTNLNGSAEEMIDLSIDLADASIDLVQNLSDTDSLTRLGDIVRQYMTMLCGEADSLAPLFGQPGAAFPAESKHLIKAMMNNSSAVIDKLSVEGLPGSEQQIVGQFLVSLLETFAEGAPNIQGCSVPPSAQDPMIKAMLKIAAHSLEPMSKKLTDEGKQIGWALRGVSLSLDATESLAMQMNPPVHLGTVQIKQVLGRLQNTFESLSSGLNEAVQIARAQTVLRLAAGIPAAFSDLLESASSQASELMEIYLVLMQELEKLIVQAPSGVDFYALPLALINETQDLSLLNQCQKFGLANLAHVLSLGRELSAGTPALSSFIDRTKTIHSNIKQCDASGIAASPEIEQTMAMLDLAASVANNNQQTLALVKNALPSLIPLFVEASAAMIDATQALVTALPVADFTRDDLGPTLDATLNRLLSEAEIKTTDTEAIRSIREARSIINHADLNMAGLTLTRDDAGKVITIRELRADGALRIFDLQLGGARQAYPEGHPDHQGGLNEYLNNVAYTDTLNFDQLDEADKNSLFTPFWDNLIDEGSPYSRTYKDDIGNTIQVDATGAVILVKIIDAISHASFTPQRVISVSSLPARDASAAIIDAAMDQVWTADIYRENADNPGCHFSEGCAYRTVAGSAMLTVQSVTNPQHFAIYIDQEENRSSLDDIKPSGALLQFNGYINSIEDGWVSAWKIEFLNNGELTLRHGSSIELLSLGDSYGLTSPMEIPALLNNTDSFVQRRVVNGNDIWNYLPGEKAVHSFGDGDWEIYSMPQQLPVGTSVPAPDQTIDVATLTLMARGNRTGITEDPAGLTNTATSEGQTVLTIPAADAADVITIPLTGDNAGEVMLGDVGIAVTASADVNPADVASTEQQPDGGQLITLNDGSSVEVRGTNADNLKITRTTRVEIETDEQGQSRNVNYRTTQIQYCEDGNVSWAACPAPQLFDRSFDYAWFTDYSSDQGYVDYDLNNRPVVTPVVGINASIKHQKWVEIFTLEQSLLQQPSEQGLQQLKSLVEEGVALGLPVDELFNQQRYISARIINLLIIKNFIEVDEFADDFSKQQYWKQNPSAAPVSKILALIDQLELFGFDANQNFNSRYLEVLNLSYRLYLHDLDNLQFGDSNGQIAADLSAKTSSLFDIIVEMKRLGDVSSTTTNYDFACNAVQRVRDYTETSIYNNPSYIPLDSDFKLIIAMEAAHENLGCAGESNLAEFTQLYADSVPSDDIQASIKVIRLRRLGQSILRQDPVLDDFNGSGSLNSEDVIHFYLGSMMGVNSISDLQPPTAENQQEWTQHILYVDRLIKEIEGEKIRRGGNAAFYSTEVIAFKYTLIELLKQGWESDYIEKYNQFVEAGQTTRLADLKALAKHYETSFSINSRLANVGVDNVIQIDADEYLEVNIANNEFSPLQQITANQTVWLDIIWLQSAIDNPDMQAMAQMLTEQDSLIKYLLDNLPGDQLAGIQRFEDRVSAKMNLQMDAVASALAAHEGVDTSINPLVEPISVIDQFLSFVQLNDSQQLFQNRIQQLLDQAVNRVKDNSDRTLSELQKIIAINTARSGNNSAVIAGLEDNVEFRAAIHEAGTNAIYAVSSGGDSEDIRHFLEIVAIEQKLNFSDPEWSLTDVYDRVRELIEQARNDLINSNDLGKIPIYLEIMAQAQLLGMDENMDFDPAVTVLTSHIQDLAACEALQNCTISHVRTYLELYAALYGMGYEGLETGLAQVESMAASSPLTMAESLRFDKELPDLKKIVLADKTGNVGRLAAAASLERLGNSLSVSDIAGRAAIRGVIFRLRSLAGLTLPVGSVKPAPAEDLLLVAANNLQQKLDNWLAQITEEIISNPIDNSGQTSNGGIENVVDTLDISEEELNEVVLPAINGDPTQTRVVRGSKYRLAAQALAEITNRDAEAWRELSYQLLQNLPDPEITAEGDYRLSAITQLTAFMLKRAGQLATDSIDADSLQETTAGAVLFTLLNLPAEQKPAQKLAALIETQLISPLVSGTNAALECSNGPIPCLLGASLQFVGLGLDSLIATAATSDANDPERLARFLAEQLAINLADLSSSGNQDDFWFGLAGEGLGISLKALDQGADLQKEVVIGGLAIAQKLLRYQPVENLVQNLSQPVPMAFHFVRDASEFLADSLDESSDSRLAVAIARLTTNALTDSIRPVNINLADFSSVLMNWQLDFTDNNWLLIQDAASGSVNAEAWLNAMIQKKGVASLSCQINELNLLGNVQIPAALVMTPFVSASSLLKNRSSLGNQAEASKILVDLAADLSNVWFTPLSGNCDEISTEEQLLAKLIRPLRYIDPNKKPDLIALQLVGNLGIGVMDTFLPNTPFAEVMNLMWTGKINAGAERTGTGVSDFMSIAMAGEPGNLSTLYTQVETIPVTSARIVEVITSNPNDPAAKLLRLLSGNTSQGDLLLPDRILGSAIVYKIPHSLLAILGDVRKAYTPPSVTDFVNDEEWGYLKTMPVVSFDGNVLKIIDAEAYAAALAEIVVMATQLNATGAIGGVQDTLVSGIGDVQSGVAGGLGQARNALGDSKDLVRKGVVTAADIARMGINGIATLLDPDFNNQQAVTEIQQHSIFGDLAGVTEGFSGVSGGLQREWPKGSGEFGNLTLEMYGQLVFPFMGRAVGLMQLVTNQTSHLHFEGAQQTEGVGDLVGGLTGSMTADLSLGSDRKVGLEYSGTMDLSLLSNTIAGASVSGLINDFEIPNPQNFDPAEYLARQAQDIDIMQCMSATSSVVPFPLSMTGMGATATVAGFAEKKDIGLMLGTRVGLTGNMNMPVFTSLLGIESGGTVTIGYAAELAPDQGQGSIAFDSCVRPDITLLVLGQTIPVSGAEVRVETFVEADSIQRADSSVATGLKLQVGLNSGMIKAFSKELGCDGSFQDAVAGMFVDPGLQVAKSAAATVMCPMMNLSQPSLWVVLRNVSATQNEIMMGLGNLPGTGSSPRFFKAEINPMTNLLPKIGISDQVGAWGGWNESDNIQLCRADLCEMNP